MSLLADHSDSAFNINRFGTVINCIDGRVQDSVARWLKMNYQLDYIDTITEPGPDKILAEGDEGVTAGLRRKAEISVQVHKSGLVALAGHYDCAGNPVAKEVHLDQIKRGLEKIRLWQLPVTVIGLWVDECGIIETVA
jgi:hypothetical protein